jgi:hypothetical protein
MNTPDQLICTVHAAQGAAKDLAEIVRFSAQEIQQPIDVLVHETETGPHAITLHLLADDAATQHPAWCLACRLSCFCPTARVSVLVVGAEFSTASARTALHSA